MCCSPWGRKEVDTTEGLNWTEYKLFDRPSSRRVSLCPVSLSVSWVLWVTSNSQSMEKGKQQLYREKHNWYHFHQAMKVNTTSNKTGWSPLTWWNEKNSSSLCYTSPNLQPHLITRNLQPNSNSLWNTQLVFFKSQCHAGQEDWVTVTDQRRLRRWWLNAMWWPGLDSGTEKGHPDRAYSLVNSITSIKIS